MPGSKEVPGSRMRQDIHADRDAYVAGRDLTVHYHEASASLGSGIKVRTQRTEYTNFLLFNPRTCEIPGVVPEYSFVHYEHGLVSNAERPSVIGVNPDQYTRNIPPHIADGEIVVDFTILNEGPATAVVSSVELEIVEVLDIPVQSSPGGFWPVLEAVEDSAIITREHVRYRLFRGKTLAYRSGEVDLLRVNVLVKDEEEPSVFGFRFNVHYPDSSGSDRVAHSDICYLAKSDFGPSRRIPFEKKRFR